MGYQVYLIMNGITLPLPTSYSIGLRDVEADTGGETEAGTIQRDIIRRGMVSISVSFNCSPKWVKQLSSFEVQEYLQVRYLNTLTLELETTQMYMEGFNAQLVKDTAFKGLWEVSFNLYEY